MTPLALDCRDLPPFEVKRRFRWATRQGRPAWLWPDVAMSDWRDALRQIESSIRAILRDGSCAIPLDANRDAIGLAGYTSGAGPILGWWLEQGMLSASPKVAAELQLHLRHNRLRAARLEAAAVALAKSLLEQGIHVTILKGLHTAGAYFPEPGTRPAADIDMLVGSARAEAAEAVIKARGFVEASRSAFESSWRLASVAAEPRSLMLVHADDPWSIDLHRSLDIVASRGAAPASLDRAAPMKNGDAWQSCPGARVLAQPLLLLHLAAHASAGLHNMTLLRLLELCLVVRKDRARLSWDEFLAVAARTGSLGHAYPALKLCEDLAPGTVPTPVLDRCARQAPNGVVTFVDKLTPANAQRVDRSSLAEHFMWESSWVARLRRVAFDLAASRSWHVLGSIYEKRAWRLVRGRISR